MAKVRIKELDSLFILRHAQRNDKIATTTSSIDFVSNNNQSGYLVTDTYNPPLATFQSTNNKSNNGYAQSMNLGQQLLNYIDQNIDEDTVQLKFHTSPYLRCIETIKYIVDYLVKSYQGGKTIRCIIVIDQVLSEWLSTDLDINFFPPHDNGASLLGAAIQYLNSNLPFHRNMQVEIQLDYNNSYQHGNPGCFNESLIQQYSRLNNGLISIIKHEHKNLSMDPNTKDVVLIMTHGACVRSLVSKLLGKSLYVEIPLASLSIAKPLMEDSKHYYWQLLKTDISTKLPHFQQIDLYSKNDPFQDFQTTFSHKSNDNQLNFKNLIPASKTENFNRIRSQSLLTPRRPPHDSDDEEEEEDSSDEGISFSAGTRRRRVTTSASTNTDNQRRFRSSSLFGPVLKNPFFSDDSLSDHHDSFERRKKSLLDMDDELISPIKTISKPTTTATTSSSFQNIHADDGTFGKQDSNDLVPDLGESLSSNNSSTHSLSEEMSVVPGTFSKPSKSAESSSGSSDTHSLHEPTPPYVEQDSSHPSREITPDIASDSQITLHPKNPSSIFDKSLIEKTLNELQSQPQQHKDPAPPSDWLLFNKSKDPQADTVGSSSSDKFKINLYGKKDRLKLNLYGDANDEDDDDGMGGWFLGSNKY